MKQFILNYSGDQIPVELEASHYANNRKAFYLRCCDGIPEVFGKLTINMEEIPLAKNEICVKTWSENAPWYRQVLEACPEIFEDTGRRFQAGYCEGEIWQVKEPFTA